MPFWEWFCFSVCLFCKLVIQGTGFWQTCLESLYTEGLIWMKVKACSVNLLSWSSALRAVNWSSGQGKEQGSDAPGWTPALPSWAVRPWVSCWTSLSLNFLICQIKLIKAKLGKNITVGLYSAAFRICLFKLKIAFRKVGVAVSNVCRGQADNAHVYSSCREDDGEGRLWQTVSEHKTGLQPSQPTHPQSATSVLEWRTWLWGWKEGQRWDQVLPQTMVWPRHVNSLSGTHFPMFKMGRLDSLRAIVALRF